MPKTTTLKNLKKIILQIFMLACISLAMHAQPPQVFNVTGGGSYCEGGLGMPVGLAGSEPDVSYTLIRNSVATSTIINGNGAALSFGNQPAGTYTIEGTNINGTVLMNGNAIIVQNTIPDPPAGNTVQTFCSADAPSLSDLMVTGVSILWYAVPSGGTPIMTDQLLVDGNHYYASQTVNGCESTSRLDVTAVVNTTPAAPTGSAAQTFCSGTLPTVADLVATGSGLKWYAAATGGASLAPATALVNGNHYFASQTVNGCESTSRLNVTAFVNTSPAAPTGSTTQTFCSGGTPAVSDLAASGTAIQWYAAATGGTPLPSSTALVNGTHYYASQTINGCESITRLNVTAVVNAALAAPTGSVTQTFCSGTSPIVGDLVATGSGIQWYSAATGGTPLAPATALVNGNHYYASQTVNGCESISRLNVTAVVNASPVAPTGSATQTFCSGDTPAVSDLAASGTAIQWYAAATGGTPLPSSTALVNGTHYYASQTVNGCESTSRLNVTAVVNTTAAPTGAAAQSFCSSASPTVANLVAAGTAVRWYAAATGGTPLASSTPLVNGTHYYASQTVNGCESGSRLDVTANVNVTPVVTNQTTAIMTGQAFSVIPSGSGVPAGTTYTWTAPSVVPAALTGGTAQTIPQTSISGTLYLPSGAGSAIYTVTPHNGTCTGNTFSLTVFVTSSCVAASFVTQPANDDVCVSGNASFSVSVNGSAPLSYRWQYFNGTSWVNTANNTPAGAVYTGATTSTLNISGINTAGNYQFRCNVMNCSPAITASSDAATLIVNALPAAPAIGSVVQPSCTVSTGTITISSPTGIGIAYSINGTDYTNTTGVFSNVPAGNHTVTARNSAGCTSTGTLVTVNAQPATPPAPTVTLVQPSCSVATGTITVTAPTGAGMLFSIDGSTYTNTTGVFSSVPTGNYTVTARNASGCTSQGTSVTINAHPETPVVITNNPDAVCSPSTVNLTLPAVTAGSTPGITFTYWTNAQGTIAYPTPAAAGNGTYYIRGTNASGCSDIKPVTVTVNPGPAANPGSGGNECDLNFQLSAVLTPGATGAWTRTSGPGTAVFTPSANDPGAIVEVSQYGTYTFAWTETRNSCTNVHSVTVNFYEQPVANAGTGGNNCGLTFILNGSMNAGTGVWTRVSGPGSASFDSSSDPHATVTVTAYGTHIFRWTVTNGTCTSNATVSVVFVQQPAADAGSGGEECDLNFTLNASGSLSGTWSMLSGPGNATFSNSSQANSVVTVSMPGLYEFAWTIQNITCRSTDAVTVLFRNPPAITAGADTAICEGTSAQLHARGTGTFIWSPVTGLNNPDIADPVASPTVTTTYTVTITDQLGCTNTDDVQVSVSATPFADAGPDQVLQFITETNLNAAPVPSGTGTWTVIAGNGNVEQVNNPNSKVTGLTVGGNEFRWIVDNGVCPAVSDDIVIMVSDLVIPTLITPDHSDQYNEYFVINGIQNLGRCTLTVFDRRGLKVFENSDYNNDWNGVDHNNTDLPEDTYFYVLKTQNGRSFSGFIVIKR